MNALRLATVLVAVVSAVPNIVELAKSVDDLSTLVTALVAGELVDTLSSKGPFTVFAPTNEAFAALPYNALQGLLKPENKDVLVDILKNHVLPEQVLLKDFNTGGIAYKKSVAGHDLSLSDFGHGNARVCAVSDFGLGCHNILTSDNLASNGVVHTIGGLLTPGTTPLQNRLVKANIVELAKSRPDLSTFVAAVVAGGLVDTLSTPGKDESFFTVFAPTNAAFDALPAGTLDSLLKPENKAELVDILTYHVLPTQVQSKYIQKYSANGTFTIANAVEGKPLRLLVSSGNVMVGPNSEEMKSVTSADNFAANGIIHIVDGVLLPSAVANNKTIGLTSFKGRDCSGELEGTIDIKDGACRQFPKAISISAQKGDQRIICEPNGDALILNYGSRDGSCSQPGYYNWPYYLKEDQCLGSIEVDCNPAAGPNIVQLAQATPDLSTLVTAVVAANLAGTLSSVGPFTVFAPTNEAFAALPAGVLAKLLERKNIKQLADVLLYHTVSGKVLASDLKNGETVKTVEGADLKVAITGGKVMINDATVITPDNIARNGVVHIIDTVLTIPAPATKNIVELAEATKDLSILVGAIVAAGLADTLSAPGHFTVFAPTDAAFKALPPGTLASLMKPENKKKLADILTYHVLPEKVLSTDLKAFQAVKTVEGKPVDVTVFGGHVKVGASLLSKDLKDVIAADNLASNGVVHIIDGVLLPPAEEDTTITLV